MVRIPATVGALMLGGLFSAVLSGMVIAQVILYVKFYPNDEISFKCLVFFVWALDLVHDALVWKGMWEYFVLLFGNLTLFGFVPMYVRPFLRQVLSHIAPSEA
ncbi:hypothetical protein K443DRAFT_679140 [Laccaria amethystina LaAM-08-1]|uniref:Unplaced genomic scaffold K443scaffold_89, whole genome shotgun sequence n=1 Tax=Laccaria amethystina LaAM-08-1 TaxID=1095629 RepID=A0A0C9WQG8_9AGAR|nr:hypothetical protein K443DRAFT_679140 [Laccaria amethystina LaAM-08-1]